MDKTLCPHCNVKMRKWRTPAFSTWSSEYLYVCVNDGCPYYAAGWKRMGEAFQQHCSYRHYYDPVSGSSGPLPVCSEDVVKNELID